MAKFAPICVACRREMRCRKNDYLFYDAGAVWAGDMYACDNCETQIVVGFAREPVAHAGGRRFADYAKQTNFELMRD